MTAFFTNTRLLILTIILILVSGLSAVMTMPQEEDPKVLKRNVLVLTSYPGASAERVERLVTEKIENKLREIAQVDKIRSVSSAGLSSVSVQLLDAVTDNGPPFADIRDALDEVTPFLPAGASAPLFNDDRGYAYTLMAALTWDAASEPNLLIVKRLAQELQDRLRKVSGTELVELYGAPEEEVVVEANAAVTESMGLNKRDIARTIAASDAKIAAGVFRGSDSEYLLEVRGELDTLSRLAEVPVHEDSSGAIVRVADIATVRRQLKQPPDSLAIVRGEPGVVVASRMMTPARIGDWTERTRTALDEFRRDLPAGIELQVIFDQNAYASERFGILTDNILLGIVLVCSVLFFTLGWRSSLIVTAAIPLTALSALFVLNIFGIPIHQMSITGLIVALGLLVDAAIVMTDAIRRRLLDGLTPLAAVRISIRRLWIPLLSSTLTTIIAFMPIASMPGGAGEFVGPLAWSVIIALIVSYLLAISIGAALSGFFLPSKVQPYIGREHEAPFLVTGVSLPGLGAAFSRLLDASLRAPVVSIIGSMVLPLIGIICIQTLPQQFFPNADRNQFHIQMRLAPQSPINQTVDAIEQANDYLLEQQDIVSVDWFAGSSVPAFYYNLLQNQDGQSNFAEAMIETTSLAGVEAQMQRIQHDLGRALPNAQVIVRQILQGPPTQAPIELRVLGPDMQTLQAIGEDARRLFSQVPEITHTFASLSGGEPKLWLNADEDAARQAQLSLTDIAATLNDELSGVSGGSIVEGAEQLPIRVQLNNGARADFEELSSLSILPSLNPAQSQTNARQSDPTFRATPVSALGDLTLEPSASRIERFNGERVNSIKGYVQAGTLPSTAVKHFDALVDAQGLDIPPGYALEWGGDAEARSDSVGDLMAKVLPLSVLMLATIVLTFSSFRLSLVVVIVAVQAAGLGMLSLTLAGYPFGFITIIAIIGTVGVAINAAIIIISTLRLDRSACHGDRAAVARGVMETTRHISSTTITTFGGFLPLLLSDGGFWPPFATVIAGGVILSTIISFFFVPQAFLLITQWRPIKVIEETAEAEADSVRMLTGPSRAESAS
ncbi:efflux RND transporter permease subunit [Allohahella marinimesophila]|uniref:Efflux RND transporter permease subunit n=1 Tax=Allohahella marinimesophila TaxID=1054972 RepID=A0ABP7P057_9GAMM